MKLFWNYQAWQWPYIFFTYNNHRHHHFKKHFHYDYHDNWKELCSWNKSKNARENTEHSIKTAISYKKGEMEGTYREQIPPILKHVLEVLGHNGTLFEKQN